MAMWLGAGQQYDMNKQPTITDLGKYVEEGMSWWTGMQPSGHMGKDSRLVRNETVLTDRWMGWIAKTRAKWLLCRHAYTLLVGS